MTQSRVLWAEHHHNGYDRSRSVRDCKYRKRDRGTYGGYQSRYDNNGPRFMSNHNNTYDERINEYLRSTVLAKMWRPEDNGSDTKKIKQSER